MIISASRRTDIPSYYGEWFLNALKRGYVLVQNPYNPSRYSKVFLTVADVDMIVFWTKNPIPFMDYLDEIDKMGYNYYFQFTLTPYGKETEKNLPDKELLIDTFIKLSKRLGKNRVIWRYDPVIIDEQYTVQYHDEKFSEMSEKLAPYTSRCIISFVDSYKNSSSKLILQSNYTMREENIHKLCTSFAKSAKKNSLDLYTCSEEISLTQFGINKSSCIDKGLIEEILGMKIDSPRDKNQRKECLCVESFEIGTYNCCLNGCSYCYALRSEQSALKNYRSHNPKSPVLFGEPDENAIITNKPRKSVIVNQLSFL